MSWNFGDMLDQIGRHLPGDAPALAHGDQLISWRDLDQRTNRLARAFLAAGAVARDKVAFYMRNSPAYLTTLSAAFKARLTHANINYRYTPDEVYYIIDNSDAVVLVYDYAFAPIVDAIRPRLDKVKLLVRVGGAGPDADFENLCQSGDATPLGIERSGDDEMFIYTGGTTGMPKGVIWRHRDSRELQLINARLLGAAPETNEDYCEFLRAGGGRGRFLPACPLMHGTGFLTALGVLINGGLNVTLTHPSLDADELLRTIARHRIDRIAIVGDAFAKPILKALDAAPGAYDLSSLVQIVSSGVMWSQEVKAAMLTHMPHVVLTDAFGSSEGVGLGASNTVHGIDVPTAKFTLGARASVFDLNDRPVAPGSGQPGLIAVREPVPVGYYKDPEKTARTFRVIDGVRYSLPGDWCLVEADGTLTLLGRGSACINTAGEKVFPEEVEEVLKTHPGIDDALVIGIADETWGQAVCAAVRLSNAASFDEAALKAHVRGRLAAYKVPKRILATTIAFRAPNGKADYKAVRDLIAANV